MKFRDRPETKTGVLGERIVDEFLAQKGWITYYPMQDAAHPFDRLAATPDKRNICIVEVKTKFRREAYRDTGINRSCFNDYQNVFEKYRVPIFLAFVDGREGQVYGNWWTELLKLRKPDLAARCGGCVSYPWEQGGIVYFPLSAMRILEVISEADQKQLMEMRKSNWVAREADIELEMPPTVALNGCKHKPEFVVNGRCWICEHTGS